MRSRKCLSNAGCDAACGCKYLSVSAHGGWPRASGLTRVIWSLCPNACDPVGWKVSWVEECSELSNYLAVPRKLCAKNVSGASHTSRSKATHAAHYHGLVQNSYSCPWWTQPSRSIVPSNEASAALLSQMWRWTEEQTSTKFATLP